MASPYFLQLEIVTALKGTAYPKDNLSSLRWTQLPPLVCSSVVCFLNGRGWFVGQNPFPSASLQSQLLYPYVEVLSTCFTTFLGCWALSQKGAQPCD